MATGIVSDGAILSLQILASFFMASDYFMDESQRKIVNEWLKNKIAPTRDSIKADQDEALTYAFDEQLPRTAFTLLCLGLGTFGIATMKYWSGFLPSWVIVLASLALLCLFSAGAIGAADLVTRFFMPTVGVVIRIIIWFINYCKKGSIFAIGFIFLISSFLCRFINLP